MQLPTIAITIHSSRHRPKGHFYLNNLLKSIAENKCHIRNVIIVDNQSEPPVKEIDISSVLESIDFKLIRVNDQSKVGLSGAWNLAIEESFKSGADYVINCNDDLVINETIENYIRWHNNTSNKYCYISCPITDDFGTGDRLRKLSNTKYANANNFKIRPVDSFQKPELENKARLIWQACLDDEWVIDATNSQDKPWINGFCFALNKTAYQKILKHTHELFPIGVCKPGNKNKFGITKSIWGGTEYCFVDWYNLLQINLKIIGNWYVPHHKDENKLWRKKQIGVVK
tara:strand:+ start:516 stop:1373 length:858 start_codon:yes stop_codon:yes gene_type:complete